MDFKFNVNRLLPRKINKVTQSLIPEDFRGDRRELNEYQRQLSRILDEMGEASARAQGLSKPITSAMKLRDTDHIVYLLVDAEGNGGLGCVVGLLKTGSKNLFMFDDGGVHFQLQPRCILDFYIHETRQRMGLGKVLYQHMLMEERMRPVKLAIDRPSEKFLQFLHKHYGLEKIIPQNNKFVVFQGFFDDEFQDVRGNRYSLQSRGSVDSSAYNNNEIRKSQSASINGHTTPHSAAPRSSYGRYAAARPQCSMANIIHNAPVFGQTTERTGINFCSEIPSTPGPKVERPRSLSLYSEDEHRTRPQETSNAPTPAAEYVPQPTPFVALRPIPTPAPPPVAEPEPVPEPEPEPERSPNPEPIPKEIEPVIPVHVEERPATSVKASPSCAQEVGGNQSGHLDLKFYHSPLW
ncbi:alpha-tubulin N-acetyltransferase isoform X1 [Diachasma alloeum]|uniref:alpha-tubulin N-acetyltransferase isoform X1 n=1 Tax=Diachasma alloeum TaxID=454923 RepID=UPI0007384CF5|nr:alpha-tubulin N-acetyltransferase isoform X1 [Diachasma alloeum]